MKVIKNVELSWAYLTQPDENGNFRVTFKVTPEQDAEIKELLKQTLTDAKGNSVTLEKCDWVGSRKEEEGVITYSAKAKSQFTTKQGKEVTREAIPVFDAKALPMELTGPVANGAIANVALDAYYVEYKQKKGVMLALNSVQLISFKYYTSSNPFTAEGDDITVPQNEDESLFD